MGRLMHVDAVTVLRVLALDLAPHDLATDPLPKFARHALDRSDRSRYGPSQRVAGGTAPRITASYLVARVRLPPIDAS